MRERERERARDNSESLENLHSIRDKEDDDDHKQER